MSSRNGRFDMSWSIHTRHVCMALAFLLLWLLMSAAPASDHQNLEEWCQESQAQLAACVVGALVVVPVRVLEEAGEAFEAACVADGGEYRDDVGTGYPHQYGCTTWGK